MLEVELLRRKHWNRKVEMVQRTLLVESFILWTRTHKTQVVDRCKRWKLSACFDRKFGKKFVVFKATSERHYDIKNERRIYRVYSGWCARCRHLMSFSLITPHLCFHVLYFRRHLDCAGRSQTLRGTAPWCTGLRIASRRIWTAADVELATICLCGAESKTYSKGIWRCFKHQCIGLFFSIWWFNGAFNLFRFILAILSNKLLSSCEQVMA